MLYGRGRSLSEKMDYFWFFHFCDTFSVSWCNLLSLRLITLRCRWTARRTCCSAELPAAQRAVLPPDVHEPPHHVVAAAGAGHERQAQGLLGGVQAAQGVGR